MRAKLFSNILFMAVVILLSGCAQLTKELLKDPEVKILDFSVSNITAESVSVNLKLNVNNPNPIPLKLGQVGYNLKLSGQQVTEGVFDKGIDIPASGANDVVIPLTFKYNAVESLVNSFLKKTLTKDYELSGTAKMGFFSIPFNKKGEINFKK
jgi:LEA14-like dessication related protein